MTFPMDNPFLQFVYWFLNTPIIGAVAVAILAGGMLALFAGVLRWISLGGKVDEKEQYVYPTVGLHHHHEP